MPDNDDNFIYEAIDLPPITSSEAKQEISQLEDERAESPPNSVEINLGRFLRIKWHADSSVPVFCFVTIIILLVFGLLAALISEIRPSQPTAWVDEVFKFLGQVILTLTGAVVGAAATRSITRSSGSKRSEP